MGYYISYINQDSSTEIKTIELSSRDSLDQKFISNSTIHTTFKNSLYKFPIERTCTCVLFDISMLTKIKIDCLLEANVCVLLSFIDHSKRSWSVWEPMHDGNVRYQECNTRGPFTVNMPICNAKVMVRA